MNFKKVPVKHIVVYSLLMLACAFYFGKLKSDNYGYSLMFAISITYAFYPLLHFTWKKIQLISFFLLIFFFLMPLLIAFASYEVLTVIINATSLHATSTETVIFMMTYVILSDIFVLLVWRKRQANNEGIEEYLTHVEK